MEPSMTGLLVLSLVFLLGLALAVGHIRTGFLARDINGYPAPMIVFAGIAAVGILLAGALV